METFKVKQKRGVISPCACLCCVSVFVVGVVFCLFVLVLFLCVLPLCFLCFRVDRVCVCFCYVVLCVRVV